jgi:hypothetical protein
MAWPIKRSLSIDNTLIPAAPISGNLFLLVSTAEEQGTANNVVNVVAKIKGFSLNKLFSNY